jgi:DNA-binding CsgD family transcriptional regulator
VKHFLNTTWRLPDRLLGWAGDHGPAISPQRLQQLTWQERQVATLACLRFTNRQIARQPHVSPYTVRAHVRTTSGKPGLQDRAALRQCITVNGLYGSDRAGMRTELGLGQGHSTGSVIKRRPPG